MDLSTLELVARSLEAGIAWLDAKSAHQPCRDADGQFASCGVSSHQRRTHGRWRAQERRRRPRDADHADWLRHFKKERRDTGRYLKRERRDLRKEQRKERRELNRDSRKEVRQLKARHAREAAKTTHPARTAERHREERGSLAETIRGDRRDKREQWTDERRDLRASHRETAHSTIEDLRASHAEYLRGKLDERHEAREATTSKRWKTERREARVPSADAILARALDSLGLADAYHAGTLTGRQPLDVLHAVRLEGRRWLRAAAEALLEEVAPDEAKALFGGVRAKVGAFFGRAKKYVRELFAAGVLAIAGPDPGVLGDPVVQTALAEQVRIQDEYLDRFEKEVVKEAKPLDGTFVARAEMYGASTWGAVQDTMIQSAVATGRFKECRRVHVGEDVPCDACAYEQSRGWIPLSELLPIGQTPCRCNCHCHVDLRMGPGSPVVMAGRHLRAA